MVVLQTRKLLAHKIEGWIICTFAASKYREMRLILILAGGLFLTTSTAQSTDSLQALNLEEITVKESRLKMPLTQTMHAITLIEGADLRKMNAQSLMQVLQYAGGLDLRQRGVHGVQGDISIRGGTFDQVLVLVDGIPLSDPQTGHHLMNIPVPLDRKRTSAGIRTSRHRFTWVNVIVDHHPVQTAVSTCSGESAFAADGPRTPRVSNPAAPIADHRGAVSISFTAGIGWWRECIQHRSWRIVRRRMHARRQPSRRAQACHPR